ncbi:MAG: sigma factor-like helix-turn-helix DNA-binding protein [Pseudomonadota bacterium]
MQGLSYEDAANELAVPLGTIRSRLFRARANLMQRIDPEGQLIEGRRMRHRAAERAAASDADLH